MSTKIIKLELLEKFWLNPNMKILHYTPWAKQKKNETPLFWAEVTLE